MTVSVPSGTEVALPRREDGLPGFRKPPVAEVSVGVSFKQLTNLKVALMGVGIAEEVGGVGDLGAVRRKKWTGLHVPIGGESLGVATLPADGPDIAGVEGTLSCESKGLRNRSG